MGYGYWTRDSFIRYSTERGRTVDAAGRLDSRLTDRQIFTQTRLHPTLNPRGVVRECCDSTDHPETVPVILALDVTGSMGPASVAVAREMNEVMTRLYDRIRDVEFLVMGIGDLAYDMAPIQMSQFEADIRIAEQLDRVYMEHGGGGNDYESYTAAWYMGLHHTRLDCWKRGKKGLIITMGDETLNPYLPAAPLSAVTGDRLQADVETPALYRETLKRFDIYHIHVNHQSSVSWKERVLHSFGTLLPRGRILEAPVAGIAETLIGIITDFARDGKAEPEEQPVREIAWETGDPAGGEERMERVVSW